MASQSASLASTSPSSSFSTSSTPRSPPSPRLVRFEDRCVLIPECSTKSPRIMTKSYSLPIVHLQLPWKRTSPVAMAKETPPDQQHVDTSLPADHLTVKVPIPTFRRKSRSPIRDAESRALPPCLIHRHEHPFPPLSASLSLLNTPSSSSSAGPRGRPVRSASLPMPPSKVETVPLRPCCTTCFAACTSLPPLFEASQEHAHDFHVHHHPHRINTTEDWCEGMHFTKGALRRRRSASMEGEGFHAALLRVDEVDRGPRATKPTACSAPNLAHLKPKGNPEMRSSGDGSEVSDRNEDDSELFPLPSPKRTPTGSPSPSPSASAQNLSSLVPHEPGKLESAIRNKISQRAREQDLETSFFSSGSTSATTTLPIPIPEVASHFHSHVEEIEYDKSLPDPDALPSSSTILLNSPPSSPPFDPSSPNTLSNMPNITLSSSPSMSSSKRRRPSLSAGVVSIVNAGVGVLRGISLSTNSSISV